MALDPNKKFLYFNKDETLTEMDLALCFPVSSFIGLETQTSSVIDFYFEGSKGADATIVRVAHSQHAYIKNFATSLVDEINFGDKAFIKVYDHAERDTHPSDVSISMDNGVPPTFTLEDDEFIVAGDLRVNGKLSFDGIGGVNAVDYNTAFNDSDIRLMTSKAINNRFAQINADTTGNAATATLAADATKLATPRAIGGVNFDGSAAINLPGVNTSGNQATSGLAATATLAADATNLATPRAINGVDFDGSAAITVTSATLTTPRAINGVDFDGSAAITVTAAGSTLSDTVTVAKGGTGASNLDAFGLLSGTQTFTGRKIINTRSFPISSGTDGNAIGDVVYFGGTTSMTIGTIYHYKSDGTWEVANANAVATSDGLLGVALGAASDTNGVLLRGMVTLDHDPGAVGDVLYLSNTNGDASSTAPSDNNDIVRVIGYCLHASAGNIWFNPDSTFVEVTA